MSATKVDSDEDKVPDPDAEGAAQPGLRQVDRLDAIADFVLSTGTARIEELAEMFAVSSMTIHRDLDTLDQKGILRKTRGFATAVASSLFEASPEYRVRQSKAEKQAVAQAAFDLIEPGQAIMLDDSTTGLHLAELLPQKLPLTVITNFHRIADALIEHSGIQTILTGGQYDRASEAFMGTLTLDALETLRADVVFMSSPAVTDAMCFHQHHQAVLIKRAMVQAAARKVLYLDHTKFSMTALHASTAISDFDTVIVDSLTSPEHIEEIRKMQVELIVVESKPAK